MKQKDTEKRNTGDPDSQIRSHNSEGICTENRKVIVEMDHKRNGNTMKFDKEMDRKVRNNYLNIHDMEREQDTFINSPENSFTAEKWENDQVQRDGRDQTNVVDADAFGSV